MNHQQQQQEPIPRPSARLQVLGFGLLQPTLGGEPPCPILAPRINPRNCS
jgi:hypothetical protein